MCLLGLGLPRASHSSISKLPHRWCWADWAKRRSDWVLGTPPAGLLDPDGLALVCCLVLTVLLPSADTAPSAFAGNSVSLLMAGP